MSTATKCKRCGRIIVRNVRGEWGLPHSIVPTTLCSDGVPHEPDKDPDQGGTGTVIGIAIGSSIADAGLI